MAEGTRNYYSKQIDIEVRDSVINLMRQNLIIEVWDYSPWSLNKFIGIKMVELIGIIKGNTQQFVLIEVLAEDGKTSNILN